MEEEHHREAGEGTRVPVLVRCILLPLQTWTLVILQQQEVRRTVALSLVTGAASQPGRSFSPRFPFSQ